MNFVTRHLGTDLFAKLACGKIDSCPFGEALGELREDLYQLFQGTGAQPRKRASDEESPLSSDSLALS